MRVVAGGHAVCINYLGVGPHDSEYWAPYGNVPQSCERRLVPFQPWRSQPSGKTHKLAASGSRASPGHGHLINNSPWGWGYALSTLTFVEACQTQYTEQPNNPCKSRPE
jgi:hypothetical protein